MLAKCVVQMVLELAILNPTKAKDQLAAEEFAEAIWKFQSYYRSRNPNHIPFYPWFRVDEDRLWFGGRILYSKGFKNSGRFS